MLVKSSPLNLDVQHFFALLPVCLSVCWSLLASLALSAAVTFSPKSLCLLTSQLQWFWGFLVSRTPNSGNSVLLFLGPCCFRALCAFQKHQIRLKQARASNVYPTYIQPLCYRPSEPPAAWHQTFSPQKRRSIWSELSWLFFILTWPLACGFSSMWKCKLSFIALDH